MRCDNILLRAVAASFKARVGHSSGVSTKLYRFVGRAVYFCTNRSAGKTKGIQ